IGLGCATDLINLWVWFEAMAVTSYLLVAFYKNQSLALEAGVKYLVQSATGSMLVVIGIALVLMQTGTLNLAEIRSTATPSAGLDYHLCLGRLMAVPCGLCFLAHWGGVRGRPQRDAAGARRDGDHLDGLGRAAHGLRRVQHARWQPDGAAPAGSLAHAGLLQP